MKTIINVTRSSMPDYKEYCNVNLRKHQRGAKEDDRLLILAKNKKEVQEKKSK